MKALLVSLKSKSIPFIQENRNLIVQFILTVFFIGIGIWFIHHEESELHEVRTTILSANIGWLIAGIILSMIYLFLHGYMYREAFISIGCKLPIITGTILFLKRNFISVFLPAGGVSSLAFFTGDIEKQGITKTQIHLASTLYGFIGIVSVILIAIPAFIYGLVTKTIGSSEWLVLLGILLLIAVLYFSYKSLINKGYVFNQIKRWVPSIEVYIDDLRTNKINRNRFLSSLFFSILIEFSGILHLFIAMKALGFESSWFTAVLGYIVAVVFLIISPFLRGVGPVEVSLTYVLSRFGFTTVQAIAITFLYRFFEFWIPLLAGLITFLAKVNKLLMRILPAILLFALGVVNIISGMTPAINERLEMLKDFLPINIITASNYFVIVTGLLLLITATFMLKGLRNAWYFALFLSIISFVGHLTKAIDYEEAIVAFVVIVVLFSIHKEYYIRSNLRLRTVGIQTVFLSIFAVLIYGVVGFYYLNKKHFGIDFNFLQSVRYTFLNYILVGSDDLIPNGAFARHFILSINISGFITMLFLVFTLIRPYIIKPLATTEEMSKAINLVKNYGNSGLDFFKTYYDKLIFFPEGISSFISYRISGNFAVVLENPVAENVQDMAKSIRLFYKYCRENGVRSLYYRVPEESLSVYRDQGKKALFIGQEGIVNIHTFSLEGGNKKAMRNAVHKVRERGYKTSIHSSPVKDGVLQKLKSVSDEWLRENERKEIVFSQGIFNWDELKQQTILSVESPEEKIVAFINIIPDYAKGEATYDLIRKTNDAPNGVMDYILVELFQYLKSQGYNFVNLGFAPMSGIQNAQNFPERSMKFAYEKIRSFAHYKGLRDYKEKFAPTWYNKYLIYEHDYDLLQAPSVLNNVIKP
jgi:phosphatidylglycerol lysyltransferase